MMDDEAIANTRIVWTLFNNQSEHGCVDSEIRSVEKDLARSLMPCQLSEEIVAGGIHQFTTALLRRVPYTADRGLLELATVFQFLPPTVADTRNGTWSTSVDDTGDVAITLLLLLIAGMILQQGPDRHRIMVADSKGYVGQTANHTTAVHSTCGQRRRYEQRIRYQVSNFHLYKNI